MLCFWKPNYWVSSVGAVILASFSIFLISYFLFVTFNSLPIPAIVRYYEVTKDKNVLRRECVLQEMGTVDVYVYLESKKENAKKILACTVPVRMSTSVQETTIDLTRGFCFIPLEERERDKNR